ncbi:MAG: hypothetical protein GXO65_04455 [Euryarchaeota archaeon]|nr:hypothetical protein [Euryarchaeota archaeon]
MDQETERRVALFHAFVGAVVGAWMGFNYHQAGFTFVTVILLGLVISYPLMFVSRKLFSLSPEEFQVKEWLAKGFFNFFMTWLVAWVFAFNLA